MRFGSDVRGEDVLCVLPGSLAVLAPVGIVTRPEGVVMSGEDAAGSARHAAANELIEEGLAMGLSQTATAEFAGVSLRTVARRAADPDVRKRVADRRAAWMAEVTGQLTNAAVDAVRTIRTGLTVGRAGDRLRAASLILTLGAKFRSDTELEDRLHRLEIEMGIVAAPSDEVEIEDESR